MKIRIIVAALIIVFSSCEKEVIIDVPEHQPLLVVNSEVYDDTIAISVGKSIDVLKHKYGNDLYLKNATVILEATGKAAEQLTYDESTGYHKAGSAVLPGVEYKIRVSAEGFKDATATTKTPQKVTIKSVQRIKDVRLDISGMKQDEIRLTFDDDGTQDNYYIVRVNVGYMPDSFSNYVGTTCVNTTDPSVESIYDESIDQNTCIESDGIFLRDDLFNGKTKELRLYIASDMLNPAQIPGVGLVYTTIELLHVTEEYFKYLKSYRYASINSGNPFAEPTNVYTNITNGYGIFTVIQSDVAEIR